VSVLLGAALGVGACDSSRAEGQDPGKHISLTVAVARARVDGELATEEVRRKEQALLEQSTWSHTEEERERIRAELERVRAPKAVYGAPPPRTMGSSNKPCGCQKGDPLCSCF
jgi:hypothetical protein